LFVQTFLTSFGKCKQSVSVIGVEMNPVLSHFSAGAPTIRTCRSAFGTKDIHWNRRTQSKTGTPCGNSSVRKCSDSNTVLSVRKRSVSNNNARL